MIALAIALTGLGTYAMRACFIFALARYRFPDVLLKALEFVAPTVMGALVVTMMTAPSGELTAGLAELVGLCSAGLVAIRFQNHILTLFVGMGLFWITRALL